MIKTNILKPVIYIVLVPTIFILGIIWIASRSTIQKQENASQTLANSEYKLDKNTFSFGTISQKDGNVTTTYKLTNNGNEDILVKELYTSCMCTKAQIFFSDGTKSGIFGMKGMGITDFSVNKPIKPNETVDVVATFDPNAHGPQGIGFIKRNVIIETNLQQNSTIQLSFDAQVTK